MVMPALTKVQRLVSVQQVFIRDILVALGIGATFRVVGVDEVLDNTFASFMVTVGLVLLNAGSIFWLSRTEKRVIAELRNCRLAHEVLEKGLLSVVQAHFDLWKKLSAVAQMGMMIYVLGDLVDFSVIESEYIAGIVLVVILRMVRTLQVLWWVRPIYRTG